MCCLVQSSRRLCVCAIIETIVVEPSPTHSAEVRALFEAGLTAVEPGKLVRALEPEVICDRSVHQFRRLVVLAAGKAALPMAAAVPEACRRAPDDGLVTVPDGYTDAGSHAAALDWATVLTASHPLPDRRGAAAADRAMALAACCNREDLLVVLLSGGGSALWGGFQPGIDFADGAALVAAMQRAGFDIQALNTVRRHISVLAGGRLALAAAPATVCTLALSDVIGDDPAAIASGPTVPDETTWADARALLDELPEPVPPTVLDYLQRCARNPELETAKPGDPSLQASRYRIIGTNDDARSAAARAARQRGWRVVEHGTPVTGAARAAGRKLACKLLAEQRDRVCHIWGGETTVTVTGNGRGGRNQELALGAALELDGADRGITLLSAGTDGVDGASAGAGAVVDNATLDDARRHRLDAEAALRDNDSATFFEHLGAQVITGPTHTNVMDLQIGLVAE